jgi:cell wall-associated NlpC family hydrolase
VATQQRLARSARVFAPLVAAATICAGLVAISPSATADPHLTIAQVEAQLTTLQNDAANAAEEVNGAEVQLAAINVKVAALKVQLAAAQAKVGVATQAVNQMAVNAYTSGGTDGMVQALLADNPQDFLERAATLDVVSRYENSDLRRTESARLALAQIQVQLAQEQAQAAAVEKQATAYRAVINSKVAQTKTLLSGLQAAERARLAAIAAAQRAAQLKAKKAAQAQALAQQRQAAASQSSGGSSSGGSSSSGGTVTYTGNGSASSRAAIAVAYALSQVGGTYSYNADPPYSWDCSKLTAYAWGRAGVSLSAYSYAQWGETTRVSRSQLRPGDLLFYFGLGAHHVMMYIGGGQAVSASNPSAGVEIVDPWGPWYGARYSGAGRVIG